LVRLTEEGKRIYKVSVKKHEEKLSSLLSVLPEKDKKNLVKILKKLYSHLKRTR